MSISASAPGLPQKRLASALSKIDASAMAALSDRIGIARRVGARARAGRTVNASAFLQLCAAVGCDPVTGAQTEPRPIPGPVLWWFVGTGLQVSRRIRGVGLRIAAKQAGVSHLTIKRAEEGQAVSARSLVAIASWIGQAPERFTCVSNCNTTTRGAA